MDIIHSKQPFCPEIFHFWFRHILLTTRELRPWTVSSAQNALILGYVHVYVFWACHIYTVVRSHPDYLTCALQATTSLLTTNCVHSETLIIETSISWGLECLTNSLQSCIHVYIYIYIYIYMYPLMTIQTLKYLNIDIICSI